MEAAIDDHIEVLTVSSQWVAYRRVSCTHDQIGATITAPDIYPGIYEHASKHGAKSGPPFARYIEWRENDCDILCGIPLTTPIPPDGNIMVDHYTSCKLVTYLFKGPYSRLGEAHEAVIAYLKKHGLKHGGPCWEIYDGPGDENGIATTHVCYPIEA